MSAEPEIGSPLPNAHLARTDPRKFTEYALDPDSERGRDKARVFRSALGFGSEDWETLRDRILADLFLRPVRGKSLGPYPTYSVIVLVDGISDTRAWVVTAWQMRDGNPWLVTLRVATEAQQKSLDDEHPDAVPSTR